ncbi:hypothetical protein HQ529_03270 [Candidatus Woesearchaeota archaeon]|nr:hypothetical protein [Candidatus Woesearchaeota archaeon]
MKIKKLVEKLTNSKTFKDWKKQNKECYITHLFAMLEEKIEWQIGYYNKKHDMITSFIIGDDVTISDESEVFKKDKKAVEELDINKVKIDFDKAVKTADKFQKEKYPTETPMKKIIILQSIDGQIWNMTYVSRNFNTLNMRIDSETGEMKSHELSSLLSLGKMS